MNRQNDGNDRENKEAFPDADGTNRQNYGMRSRGDGIFRSFLKYVSLNVLGMIGLSCYILADTFFVSRGMGASGLSALNIAIPLYSVVNGLGLMIGVGGATRYAILRAQGRDEEADRIFSASVWLGVAVGCLLLLTGVLFSAPLARMLGADSETFEMTNVYAKTLLCFSPMFVINNVLTAFVRNDGAPKRAMAAMLTGSLSNVVLDYVFIFPCKMGMFGAALATGVAPVVGVTILLVCGAVRKNRFRLVRFRPGLGLLREICSPGIASLVTELSSGVVILAFNFAILRLTGNLGVAAYGIVANLALVAVSIDTGIAQGVQPIVSRHHGRREEAAVSRILKFAVLASLIVATLVYAAVFFFAEPISAAFNRDGNAELSELASRGLRIYFTGFVFAGPNIVIAALFASTERPVRSFLVSVLRGCAIVLPLVFTLGAAFGMTGIWISFPCAEALTAIAAILLLKMRRRSASTDAGRRS